MNRYNFTEESIWEETDEYFRLNRKTYGLPVDLLLDEVGMYKFCNHPLVVFFRNSYNSDEHNYVPVSVSETPRIVFNKKINLYNKDVLKIINWIKKYREYIRRIALGVLRPKDLYSVAAIKPRKRIINESLNVFNIPLYEMAVMTPEETGLNWKIWLDDDKLYNKGGHAKRIKIQDKRNNNNTKTWIPYRIDDSSFPDGIKQNFNHSDRCSFEVFVTANLEAIKKLADKEIDYEDFQECVRKVYKVSGSNWKVELPKEIQEPDFKIIRHLEYDYDIVYSVKYNGFNILDPDGELLLDEWCLDVDYNVYFDNINGKRKMYFIIYSKSDKIYKVYTDDYRMIEI